MAKKGEEETEEGQEGYVTLMESHHKQAGG